LPIALVDYNQLRNKRSISAAYSRNGPKTLFSFINYIADNLDLMQEDNCHDTYLIVAVPGEKNHAPGHTE